LSYRFLQLQPRIAIDWISSDACNHQGDQFFHILGASNFVFAEVAHLSSFALPATEHQIIFFGHITHL